MMVGSVMGMPGFWVLMILAALVVAVLLVVPFWMLLPKFGFSAWFSLLAVVPFGALVLLWVLAYSDPKPGGAR